MSTDIKLSEAQLTKIIQLFRFLRNMVGKLAIEALMNFAIPFVKDVLLKLVSIVASNVASHAINTFERKISGKSRKKIHFVLN